MDLLTVLKAKLVNVLCKNETTFMKIDADEFTI